MILNPETDLILTRTLAAPRALLWECWTNPRHLPEWFVPRPHKVVACDLDVRVGGRFNTTFDVEGTVMVNDGVYLEVIEGEKLVFTDTYTEGWKPAPEPFMTAIVTFADAPGGGTTYTAVARHRNPEAAKTHADMGFHDGWGAVAGQMEGFAQALAARTLTIERVIAAPVAAIWRAWTDPEALPKWWGPEGFTCHTRRIDLREGGEWDFDMIGPDGTIWPNHHRITRHLAPALIRYEIRTTADGPLHADVRVGFDPVEGGTRVTLSMTFADQEQHDGAKAFGAVELGQQTLAKLARQVGAP